MTKHNDVTETDNDDNKKAISYKFRLMSLAIAK